MDELHSTRPRVSVIIPTYRVPDYLNAAVESVGKQTFSDYELVVVDDASGDEFVSQYRLPAACRFVQLAENSGPGAARNAGIRASSGDYVAFLDADDIWVPEKLERQAAALDADPGLALTYCHYALVGDDLAPRPTQHPHSPLPRDPLRQMLRGSYITTASVVMIRRTALEDVGMFDETLRATQDYDLYMRMLMRGHSFHSDPTPLACYRRRPGQITADLARIGRFRVRTLQKTVEAIRYQRPDLLSAARRRLSEVHVMHSKALAYHAGDFGGAAAALVRGIRAWPWNWRTYGRLCFLPALWLLRRFSRRSRVAA